MDGTPIRNVRFTPRIQAFALLGKRVNAIAAATWSAIGLTAMKRSKYADLVVRKIFEKDAPIADTHPQESGAAL